MSLRGVKTTKQSKESLVSSGGEIKNSVYANGVICTEGFRLSRPDFIGARKDSGGGDWIPAGVYPDPDTGWNGVLSRQGT